MSFNDLLRDPDKPSGHTWSFVLWPRQWEAHNLLDLLNWDIHPFNENRLERLRMSSSMHLYRLVMINIPRKLAML